MITLQKVGDALKFTFTDNPLYLQNGTIEVPVNSLTLVTDNSGIATFKKSATNDIFVCASYDELGMSKAELETWFKNNAVGGGGTPSGDVQTMIDQSISGFADNASYDSVSQEIKFYNGNTEVYSVDASDFVIDGMIDDVRIETISGVTYLVIDFNKASGKEDIQIPLTDIFDPSNYYTKTEVDNAISAATDDMATETWVGQQGYQTSGDVQTMIDNSISGKADTTAVTTSIEEATSGKVDSSSVVSSVTSASTDSEIPTAKAVYDAIPTGGTSFDLPIYSGTGTNALKLNFSGVTASGNYSLAGGKDANGTYTNATGIMSFAFGRGVTANGNFSHAEGNCTKASGASSHAEGKCTNASGASSHAEGLDTTAGYISHAEGNGTKAIPLNGTYTFMYENGNAHAEGYCTKAYGYNSHAEGSNTIANNYAEHASGKYNVSSSASTTFGDSGNTLFSVGNGTANNARHNAFEIRQNGDIYISSGGTDIKLQDNLGGGGGMSEDTERLIATSLVDLNDRKIDASEVKANYQRKGDYATKSEVALKANASDVMTLEKSKENELVTASALNNLNERFGGLKLTKLSQAEYDALSGNTDSNTLYVIVNNN